MEIIWDYTEFFAIGLVKKIFRGNAFQTPPKELSVQFIWFHLDHLAPYLLIDPGVVSELFEQFGV